jgi:type II secretory pathway component PulC
MKWRIAPLGAAGLLIVLGINAWLLIAIATEVVHESLAATDKVDWNANLSDSVGSAATRKPIEAYREILARPVFFKSREPFVPAPAPPPPVVVSTPPPTIVDPGLVLGGVMIKNDVRKAYVFSRAGASGAWASEGDEFMGWQIKSINGTGARLAQKGRSIDLQLYPQD